MKPQRWYRIITAFFKINSYFALLFFNVCALFRVAIITPSMYYKYDKSKKNHWKQSEKTTDTLFHIEIIQKGGIQLEIQTTSDSKHGKNQSKTIYAIAYHPDAVSDANSCRLKNVDHIFSVLRKEIVNHQLVPFKCTIDKTRIRNQQHNQGHKR